MAKTDFGKSWEIIGNAGDDIIDDNAGLTDEEIDEFVKAVYALSGGDDGGGSSSACCCVA